MMPKGEKNAERIKNETAVQRSHRMRGIVVSDEEVAKNSLPAPSVEKIHELFTRGAGQPPCFNSREELIEACESYFASLLAPAYDEKGESRGMKWIGKPTLGGLAIHLCCDRATIWNYSKSDRYFDIIKSAKDIIHAFNEGMLSEGKNVVGAINTLVNLRQGWVADEKTIKVEPVMPDNGAKSADEISAFLDGKALPSGEDA